MSEYKEVLFKAMMWSQGVENLTKDCILKFVAKGKLSPNDGELEKIKNKYGLGGLCYAVKPAVDSLLFERLLSFFKDRNEVAHRAADKYMKHLLNSTSEAEVQIEIWRLKEIVTIAGDLYGDLLDVHESLCN